MQSAIRSGQVRGLHKTILVKSGYYTFSNKTSYLGGGLIRRTRAPDSVLNASRAVQQSLFTSQQPEGHAAELKVRERYACMHWRFEEIKCKRDLHSVILPKLSTCFRTRFHHITKDNGNFLRIFHVKSVADALAQMGSGENVTQLLLVTDAMFRNGTSIVEEFQRLLRGKVSVKTLEGSLEPGELDAVMRALPQRHAFSRHAALERAACAGADVVVGSSMSSFSWEIMLDRARDDDFAAASVLSLLPSSTVGAKETRWAKAAGEGVDLGCRVAACDDPQLRGLWGLAGDLRPPAERRSNIYYLDYLISRHVDRQKALHNISELTLWHKKGELKRFWSSDVQYIHVLNQSTYLL